MSFKKGVKKAIYEPLRGIQIFWLITFTVSLIGIAVVVIQNNLHLTAPDRFSLTSDVRLNLGFKVCQEIYQREASTASEKIKIIMIGSSETREAFPSNGTDGTHFSNRLSELYQTPTSYLNLSTSNQTLYDDLFIVESLGDLKNSVVFLSITPHSLLLTPSDNYIKRLIEGNHFPCFDERPLYDGQLKELAKKFDTNYSIYSNIGKWLKAVLNSSIKMDRRQFEWHRYHEGTKLWPNSKYTKTALENWVLSSNQVSEEKPSLRALELIEKVVNAKHGKLVLLKAPWHSSAKSLNPKLFHLFEKKLALFSHLTIVDPFSNIKIQDAEFRDFTHIYQTQTRKNLEEELIRILRKERMDGK